GAVDVIGHSRGGSFALALAKDLGQAGFRVDQVTTLDPHPTFTGTGLDYQYSLNENGLEPTTNVVFADNYYERWDIVHGQPVSGAWNNGTGYLGAGLYLPGGYS